LANALESAPNIYMLDAQRWVARATPSPLDATLWYAGKIAFGTSVLDEAALDIRAALRGFAGNARKLLVLDLDDTLWGGIVGDVGVEGIALGGHDAAGEAHVEFQRRIATLARRGVALAVVSKNEESVALSAMQQHAEMLIRPDQLAAYRINWRDKADNIVQIARQLNLGLQSVVFIDDNPAERGRVRQALPEVFVPEWPVGAVRYPDSLEALRCFDVPSISAEDGARTSMYVAERARVADAGMHQSIEDWLRDLKVRVLITPLTRASVVRASQLMNKTNQMNLRTRRLSDNELLAWAAIPEHEFWTFTVSDRFGESGLTGLLGLRRSEDSLHVADFVLSCRVMGRRVEEAMLAFAVERARVLGAQTLVVEALETAKNKPCRDLLANCALHPVSGTRDSYTWPVRESFSGPDALAIETIFQ
jgi:FkbH-like protein